MSDAFLSHLTETLSQIEADGLYKREREIVSPQAGHIRIAQNGGSRDVLNLCANNYLGLADDPRLVAAAKRSLDEDGFGMASVRGKTSSAMTAITSNLHPHHSHFY